jgi:hypothetical protein
MVFILGKGMTMKLTDGYMIINGEKAVENNNDNSITIPDFEDDLYILYYQQIFFEVIDKSPRDYFLNEKYHNIFCRDMNDFLTFECRIYDNNLLYNCSECFPVGKTKDAGINIYAVLCGEIEKIRL